MRKPTIPYSSLRAAGAGIVVCTLGGAAFSVAGAFIGPADLVGGALAIGAGLAGAGHVLERRQQRKAGGDQ